MIKDFISQIKTGALARNNRFAVVLTPPAAINPGKLQKILLFCDSVQLPGLNYSTVQNRTFGEFRETPYEKLYDALNMSFYVDNDLEVKRFFDDWMNTIQDPTTRTFNYYNNYTTKMTIEVQDLNDKTRYELKLYECYPKNIGVIQLDNSSKDIMKLQVTMQYKYWESDNYSVLADNQKISTNLIDAFRKNFTGFQESIGQTLGEAANFATGAVVTYGVTKLPGLLKF